MATRKVTKRSNKATAKHAKPASMPKDKSAKPAAKRQADPFERAMAAIEKTPRPPAPARMDRHARVQAGLEALQQRLRGAGEGAGVAHRRAGIDKSLEQLNAAYARLLRR